MASDLRKLIERPRERRFWGRWYRVTPRLLDRVFGNGARLIDISPLTTRPNFFVVRVDSGPKFDVRDILDDIKEAAEEQFGGFRRDEEEPENAEDLREFPIVDWDYGCQWSERYPIPEGETDGE